MCVAAMMGMLDGGSGDMVDASVGRHNLLKVRQVLPRQRQRGHDVRRRGQ